MGVAHKSAKVEREICVRVHVSHYKYVQMQGANRANKKRPL